MGNPENKLLGLLCPGCRRKAPTFSKGVYHWECRHRQVRLIEQAEHRQAVFFGRDESSKGWPTFDNTGRDYRRAQTRRMCECGRSIHVITSSPHSRDIERYQDHSLCDRCYRQLRAKLSATRKLPKPAWAYESRSSLAMMRTACHGV